MLGHIDLYVSVRNPLQCGLKVVLPDWRAGEVSARQSVCRAAALAEISLRVRQPTPGIDGVAQFLVCQFLSGYVYGPEPFELLGISPFSPTGIHLPPRAFW